MGLVHHMLYEYGAPSGSLWESMPAPDLPRVRLEGSESCDVAIVGAGLTGLTAALNLLENHGANVLVLDGGGAGWGASGRSLGVVGHAPPQTVSALVASRNSAQVAVRLRSAESRARTWLEAHVADDHASVRPGPATLITLAEKPQQFQSFEKISSSLGSSVEAVSAKPLATTYLAGDAPWGALVDQDATVLSPRAAIMALARRFMAAGGRLYTGTRVMGFDADANRAQLLYRGGVVNAGQILFATNGQARGRSIRLLGQAVMPILYTALATRPLSAQAQKAIGLGSNVVVSRFEEQLGPLTIRLTTDGRLLASGVVSLDSAPSRLPLRRALLMNRVRRLLPKLGDAEVSHAWQALGAQTGRGQPVIAQLGSSPRVLYAGGMDTDNLALAVHLGTEAASFIAERGKLGDTLFVQRTPIERMRMVGWRFARLSRQIDRAIQRAEDRETV